jgi:hypothetical protein
MIGSVEGTIDLVRRQFGAVTILHLTFAVGLGAGRISASVYAVATSSERNIVGRLSHAVCQ